jgi:hypothetical protein
MWRNLFEILMDLDFGHPVISLLLPSDASSFARIMFALRDPWFVVTYNDSSHSELAKSFRSSRVSSYEVWNKVIGCFHKYSNGIELTKLACRVTVRERNGLRHIAIEPVKSRGLSYNFHIYISEQPMPMERVLKFLSRSLRRLRRANVRL